MLGVLHVTLMSKKGVKSTFSWDDADISHNPTSGFCSTPKSNDR